MVSKVLCGGHPLDGEPVEEVMRRMGLGYNSLMVSEYVAHSSEVLTYGHDLARKCADPVRVDTVQCG